MIDMKSAPSVEGPRSPVIDDSTQGVTIDRLCCALVGCPSNTQTTDTLWAIIWGEERFTPINCLKYVK